MTEQHRTMYPRPEHPVVEEMSAYLNATQRECFEERAGILQFDAGLDRGIAEALSLLEIVRRYGWPPRGHQ